MSDEVEVTEEQQEAACRACGCDDLGDLHRTHAWNCDAVGKLLAERETAVRRDEREAIAKACDDRSMRCGNKPCTGTACTEAMIIAAMVRNRNRTQP